MTDTSAPRPPAPFSLRLTPEDRRRLEDDAARFGAPGMSLGAYIRWRLLDTDRAVLATSRARSRGNFPVRDHQALSALLGKLGSARIANNLNQIARAANAGALDLTPETEAELRQACGDVATMRSLLIKALGLGGGPSPSVSP